MQIKEVKEKLHLLIESTNNEALLQDLLNTAEGKINLRPTNEPEELSEEDYEDLLSLVNEPPEENAISYGELKSSLGRWFTK